MASNFSSLRNRKKIVTVREAIGDLPKLENGEMSKRKKYVGTPSKYAKDRRQGCKFATQNFVSKNKDYVLERYKYIKPGENWERKSETESCRYEIISKDECGNPVMVVFKRNTNDKEKPFENLLIYEIEYYK